MGGAPSKTLEEQLRDNKRFLNKAIRELDRERTRLEQSEAKLVQEIKKAAAANQINSVKIMAKDLVRTKNYKHKFYEMRSQLQGVSLRLQTVKSTQAMGESMKGVAKVMVRMNKTMDIPGMNEIMKEFMKENDKLSLTEEMMGDAIDTAFADGDDEEEEEKIVSSVLEEIGLDLNDILKAAPSGGLARQQAATSSGPNRVAQAAGGPPVASAPTDAPTMTSGNAADIERSLEERLNNLRK